MKGWIFVVVMGASLAAGAARSLAQPVSPPPAPGQKKEEPPVQVKAYLDVDAVRPGDTFRVAIVFTMKKGLHIYGADSKGEDVIKTKVTPPKIAGIEWEAPTYPKSVEKKLGEETFRLYEGEATVIVKGKAAASLEPGTVDMKFEIAYQACTDEYCLEPHLKDGAVLKARIAKAGDAVKPANAEIFAEKKTDAAPKSGG
ncbi:MAG: hypothetical protein HYR85_27520 [Planctomycetes bacterium]|nr:hypothetical protein [Planctomycetota bacterium]MBI3844270.1 hypothetical protein [Planctomycetota bacterium]